MQRSRFNNDPRLWLTLVVCAWASTADNTCAEARKQNTEPKIEVRVVTDEADAVLLLLEKRSRNEELHAEDWAGLQATEGYQRLKKRAETFGAEDFDESFRLWVLVFSLSFFSLYQPYLGYALFPGTTNRRVAQTVNRSHLHSMLMI